MFNEDILYTLTCHESYCDDFTEGRKYSVYFQMGDEVVLNDYNKKIYTSDLCIYGVFKLAE